MPANQDGIRDQLGRFVPGTSGNPAGRPKGALTLTGQVRKRLQENPEEADEIVAAVVQAALAGDAAMMRLLWDRMDGAVPQGTYEVDPETVFEIGYGKSENGSNGNGVKP